MIINIITFLGCLLMLVIFRKIDKSNMKLAKLRRYSSRVFDEFKKMAENEQRNFKDATIEMDILIKKSNSLTKNLSDSLREIENRLRGLDIEKTNLKKVDEDLKVISTAARDVNRQIEFIAKAKENFNDVSDKISFLNESIENLKRQNQAMNKDFAKMMKETVDDCSRDMEQKVLETGDMILDSLKLRVEDVAKSVEGASNLNYQIDVLKNTLSDLENNVFSDIKQKSDEMKRDLTESSEKVYNKLHNVEVNIDESKSKLIKTFENEVDKIRIELDNLNIHAISKKDEIVQASRTEAEEIRKKIDKFEEKFNQLEKKLLDTGEDKLNHLETAYQDIEYKFNTLAEKLASYERQFDETITGNMGMVKKDFTHMEQRLAIIRKEIEDYEENNKIFIRSDQMIQTVNDSLKKFDTILKESQEESKNLEKFFDDVQKLKQHRKNIESEIRSFQGKKDKIMEIEAEIKGLMELSDVINDKFTFLQTNITKIDNANARINALSDSYSELDSRIQELQEYENIISKNLESVNRSDILIQTIESKIKSFQKVMEKSDKRVEKINEHLLKVEENTLILKSRESEIQDVKDKFNELDGLSALIEKRIDQTHIMFKKVEQLRKEIDDTDSRLQTMFSETDKKMRQFADFIQTVDNNPILKQVKGNIVSTKNLNESVIKTVRELSNKGWDPSEISKKMLIDENSVRFIINTTSL